MGDLKVVREEPEFTYKHFIYDDEDHSVVVKESQSIISNGTTGLSTWTAAFRLVDWALENKQLLIGKNLVELGSGTGFAGILISQLCEPSQMLLTDCHHKVINLLEENVNLNSAVGTEKSIVNVRELWWGDDDCLDKLKGALTKTLPDYVLASDIIYDDTLFEPLLKTIQFIFDLNQACILVLACTVRNEDTLNSFLTLIGKSFC